MGIPETIVFGLVCLALASAECSHTMTECEFYLEAVEKLTMKHPTDFLVYPSNGSLYKFDVTDPTKATPVPTQEVITADGWETPRRVTVFNGTLPGPDIVVYENQTVIVHVKNSLYNEAITIHWHGLPVHDAPWMDGVPYITQCPIPPGQSFTYRFKATPTGTYWYHSHIGTQRTNGLYGAFIIREAKAVSMPERILQIQDWNHDWGSDEMLLHMQSGLFVGNQTWPFRIGLDGNPFTPFVIQSAFINGRGNYNPTDNKSPVEVIRVTRGTRYRFRVISAAATYPFRVSVDNHQLTVVASDGHDLEPIEAESFVIQPGERFDFEMNANQSIGNYWIRAVALVHPSDYIATAVLRYDGAPEELPTTSRHVCSSDAPCLVVNCPFTYFPEENTLCKNFGDIKAAIHYNVSSLVTNGEFKEHFLNFAFPGQVRTFPAVNGKTFETPDVNLLKQPRDWESSCNKPECEMESICRCTNSLEIGNGDMIQLVMSTMGSGNVPSHPIHLHGHSFFVLKMGYGHYNESNGQFVGENLDINCQGNPQRHLSFCKNATWTNETWLGGNVPGLNLVNPPRKDTLIIPSGGYAVVRIIADNPGLWDLHCHIESHNIGGMRILLNESFSEISEVPAGFPTCYPYPRAVSYNNTTEDEKQQSPSASAGFTSVEFWTLFGIFAFVIVLEALLILVLCVQKRRQK